MAPKFFPWVIERFFPVIHLQNCPFITGFMYNTQSIAMDPKHNVIKGLNCIIGEHTRFWYLLHGRIAKSPFIQSCQCLHCWLTKSIEGDEHRSRYGSYVHLKLHLFPYSSI